MITDWLYNKLIKSGFIQARILAWTRILAAALSAWLVQKGATDQNIADFISGSIVGIVTLYLQDLDIKVVDGKIKIALNTEPPVSAPVTPVETHELPTIK